MEAAEVRLQQELVRQVGALRDELVAYINGKPVDYMTAPEMEAHLDEQLELKSVDLVTGAELEEHVNEQLDLQSAELITRTELEDFVEERLEVASQNLPDRIFEAFD
ncbi:hypothetical protein DHEL01_v204253 [Diaporthe helianthi]|uniref:Uncharacterized protein n=1 Tax=Diaporthe helianthi TaxID=158607 RepID=A0A2P5I4B8_DIAHE|nr:hypothetical protein DHEL01_v204253 [Diaporthe helianthi]